MKDDLHLEAVERSAFVGLFRVCRDPSIQMYNAQEEVIWKAP